MFESPTTTIASARFARRQPRIDAPLELAVIIPTLNEAGNIALLIERLARVLDGLAWEAIIVDDWSSDGTPEIVEAMAEERRAVRLIRRFGRHGLSSAVVEGMLATTAPIVAVIDADLQHDEAVLPALFDALRRGGADVAIGTRYAHGGSASAFGIGRSWISRTGGWLARRMTAAQTSDPMSGLFALRRELLLPTLPRLSTTGFKILFDILASHRGPLRIAECPYVFRPRHAGTSKLDVNVGIQFLLLLVEKLVGDIVSPRLVLFALVGGLGLGVHLALLSAGMAWAGLGFMAAQALAVAGAILCNFALNNRLTYNDRRLAGWRWWRGLLSFTAICGLGAIANVALGSLVFTQGSAWWLAGVAGAAAGAIWNYVASASLTWR